MKFNVGGKVQINPHQLHLVFGEEEDYGDEEPEKNPYLTNHEGEVVCTDSNAWGRDIIVKMVNKMWIDNHWGWEWREGFKCPKDDVNRYWHFHPNSLIPIDEDLDINDFM